MSNLADLNVVPQPDTNKDYFNFKATGLKINKTYAIKFQWVYSDGQLSDWSPGFILTTSNETAPAVPTDVTVPLTATGSIPVALNSFPTNAKRVDVIITGGVFGTSRVAHSFTTAGTTTIAAPAGSYQVQLRAISPTGVTSTVGTTFTVTVADVGETIQSPTNPNGFSSKRILAGIEVSWAGTYATGTFTGFEAINIYAGSSATATNGTYEQVGVLTGNNVKNTIVVPLGTYVVYGQAVYIHAAAVNKNGSVGTIQANVTNQTLGPGKATDADINDGAVVISKLASDVLTVGNLKAGDINATSYIRAGTKSTDGLSGARVEISSSTITQTGTNVLPGLTVYGSDGTQLLRAPLTGGLTINGGGTFTGALSGASGQFDGDLGASGGNFTVRSGTVTALAGQIGNWIINENAFKSSAVSFPNIELDPVEAKIHLRANAGSSEIGNFIKMDTTTGLRIGTGIDPKFKVDMGGNLEARDATLYGKIITTGTNPNNFTGTLTIDSGYITQTNQLYLNTPFLYANTSSVYLQSSNGYFLMGQDGGVILGQGNATGDLQIRLNITDIAEFPGKNYPRGYLFESLYSSFPDTAALTTSTQLGAQGANVTINADNRLSRGRTLYSGNIGTTATLDTILGGANTGDLYFSTA